MKRTIFTSLGLLVIMVLLTGLLYPMLITSLAALACPVKTGGSLVICNGRLVGSTLIGQQFDSLRYFQSRPSASKYDALPSAASNAGPTSAQLWQAVEARRKAFQQANRLPHDAVVPTEMLFASGSGLDPHITPAAARCQLGRVSAARGISPASVDSLVASFTEPMQWGFLGQARVNVLLVNIALDAR